MAIFLTFWCPQCIVKFMRQFIGKIGKNFTLDICQTYLTLTNQLLCWYNWAIINKYNFVFETQLYSNSKLINDTLIWATMNICILKIKITSCWHPHNFIKIIYIVIKSKKIMTTKPKLEKNKNKTKQNNVLSFMAKIKTKNNKIKK